MQEISPNGEPLPDHCSLRGTERSAGTSRRLLWTSSVCV